MNLISEWNAMKRLNQYWESEMILTNLFHKGDEDVGKYVLYFTSKRLNRIKTIEKLIEQNEKIHKR